MPMGKNFKAAEGLLGSNVANLISDACAAQVRRASFRHQGRVNEVFLEA